VPNFQTEGHVRWFRTVSEVVSRYSPFVEIEDIMVRGRSEQHNRWFIVAGMRTRVCGKASHGS
jgi:hypothetical protein